jgi:NADH-quinone oxidoreductase subunit L
MLDFLLSHIAVQELIWLIVALPLLGFAINGVISFVTRAYKKAEPRGFVIFVSQITVILSFVAVIVVWYILYGLEEATPSVITGSLFSWKGFLNQPLEFGLKADQLSLVIAFIIAFVGVLAHLYSVGYLANKKHAAFYFSLFNLTYVLVLLLVLTDSFFIFFGAWQILGVIGFVSISRYFSNSGATKDATVYYIIEAISGSAFLLVMFVVWRAFLKQTNLGLDIFQFTSIQVGSHLLLPYADVICFALLIGILARSLQFPLYIWMSSAAHSSVPVFTFIYGVSSVLISTYILIRLNFLLVLSPKVLNLIGILGGVGCIYGAASALVQVEARKIISYFIISQMGLAFIGIGVGAFATSVFHVFTHAVYISALLFGVGSVVRIVGSDSVSEVSGLRRALPVTFWTTLVGVLAASGIYPLAGFFGKNGIIWEAYQRGHSILFLAAFFSVILIAIALFRMVALIFFGKKKIDKRLEESSVSMLIAMVIASFASVVIGWFGVQRAFGGGDHFRAWLEPGLATQMVHMIGEKGRFSELVLAVIVTLFVAHAGFVTWIVYVQKKRWTITLAERFRKTHSLLSNGFYLNSIHREVIIKPLALFSEWIVWKGLDQFIVGEAVIGSVGRGVRLISGVITKCRVSLLSGYIFWIVVGLIIFAGWSIF